ncbi:MAG: isopentenyl-diphosphate Delta-isomerase [Schleiferiaceae bacterium]|nr:isopentenyl-diphosphate Delta-isomerase [Schleiferiaceae bacterium]
MNEYVILVSETDEALGRMEKMEAHRKGALHRAFSVFLFNDRGETLLQQRAEGKYHSPLLWTNTCCSHPREGENVLAAAERRLHEELGIQPDAIVDLRPSFHFTYRAEFDNGLIEHELDHVLIGHFNGDCVLNPEEVSSVQWLPMATLLADVHGRPENYTAWFKIILNEYVKHLPNQ